jgi:hypothetical protein
MNPPFFREYLKIICKQTGFSTIIEKPYRTAFQCYGLLPKVAAKPLALAMGKFSVSG